MKKYKLLKDLPNIGAGNIIVDEGNRLYIQKHLPKYQDVLESELDIIRQNLDNSDWLEEIKEEPKSIYKLKEGDRYWYIKDYYIDSKDIYIENDYGYYKNLLEVGNIFLTEKEAEKELNKIKALARIKKQIWENQYELGLNCNSYGYRIGSEKVNESTSKLLCIETYLQTIDGIIFKYEEDAKRCLKECKGEWNILFDLRD